jgi:cation transport ATPase
MAKEVDTSDETRLLKGNRGYTVVWEDEESEALAKEEKKGQEKAQAKEDEKAKKEEEKEEKRQKEEERKEEKARKDEGKQQETRQKEGKEEKRQKAEEKKQRQKEDDKKDEKRLRRDKHRSMLLYYLLMGITLLWLLYVNFALFIMAVFITGLILYAHFREPFEDKPEQGAQKMEILHPIRTGFEIALGMGLFAFVCILIGAIIVGLLMFGAAFGFWSGLSIYLHP